jgi:hypothetical protein
MWFLDGELGGVPELLPATGWPELPVIADGISSNSPDGTQVPVAEDAFVASY